MKWIALLFLPLLLAACCCADNVAYQQIVVPPYKNKLVLIKDNTSVDVTTNSIHFY